MKRSGPLRSRSTKRVGRQPERAAVIAARMELAGGACEYAAVVPEIGCGWLPDRTRLEADELRGGSYRCTEAYDVEAIRMTCPRHHDWKTSRKRELLARLAEHEGAP